MKKLTKSRLYVIRDARGRFRKWYLKPPTRTELKTRTRPSRTLIYADKKRIDLKHKRYIKTKEAKAVQLIPRKKLPSYKIIRKIRNQKVHRKLRTTKKGKPFYKRDLKHYAPLAKVREYIVEKPPARRLCQRVMQFQFISKAGNVNRVAYGWGTSSRRYYATHYREMFDECYVQALGQINFSPDEVNVIEDYFIYHVKRKPRQIRLR